jgi:hypothetical protein
MDRRRVCGVDAVQCSRPAHPKMSKNVKIELVRKMGKWGKGDVRIVGHSTQNANENTWTRELDQGVGVLLRILV